MLEWIVAVILSVMLISGAAFAFLAGLGVLRFPDLFTRMHAASKAGTVGAGLILLALALKSGDSEIWVKAIATIAFFAVTSPLSAHLLAKAARQAGQPVNNLQEKNGLKQAKSTIQ